MKGRHTTRTMSLGVALMLIGLAATTVSGEPSIVSITGEQIKNIGEEVELNCTVQDVGSNLVMWIKSDIERAQTFSLSQNNFLSVTDGDRFSLKVHKDKDLSTYALKIKNLNTNDTGYYECEIQVQLSSKIRQHVLLQIKRPPKIFSNFTYNVVQTENNTLELSCKADGYPPPRISWKRDKDDIFTFGGTLYNGDVLKIPKVSRKDRGKYWCIAENGVPLADNKTGHSANVTVRINFPPQVAAVRPTVLQATGYDVSLECKIEAWPAPNITWYKSGKVVKSTTSTKDEDTIIDVLTIYDVDTDKYGDYTCKAANNLGSHETKFWLKPYYFFLCESANCG